MLRGVLCLLSPSPGISNLDTSLMDLVDALDRCQEPEDVPPVDLLEVAHPKLKELRDQVWSVVASIVFLLLYLGFPHHHKSSPSIDSSLPRTRSLTFLQNWPGIVSSRQSVQT